MFFASYLKRWLEPRYDALMRSAALRPLMNAGAPTRYGVEATLYALTAWMDQRWAPESEMGKLIKEVAKDAPVEISRRMVNAFRDEVLTEARRGNADQYSDVDSETAKIIEITLLNLDDETLGPLLVWMARITPEERAKLRPFLGTLSSDEMRRTVRMPPEELASRLADFTSTAGDGETESTGVPRSPSRFEQAVRAELAEAHRRVDEQLAARRRRKR